MHIYLNTYGNKCFRENQSKEIEYVGLGEEFLIRWSGKTLLQRQWLKRSEKVSCMDIWGKSISGREINKGKGPVWCVQENWIHIVKESHGLLYGEYLDYRGASKESS